MPSAFATTEHHGEQFIDSGASLHLCPDLSRFRNFRRVTPIAIHAADRLSFEAIGRGDVETILPNKMCLRFAPAQEVHTISTVKRDNMIELESEVDVQTSSSMKSGYIFLK
ncbi:hypothetical protein B0H14DRAFT_2391112 [Mycena olivaceomarginata]|nr:hypothetical protein B0H14DRAFT_2391112 [Mycena olivaceomarginata]